MSTRACYTFRDGDEEYHVYKHHDGYPTGAAEFIIAALKYAWELPRFEADEFAAAFVAANKHGARGVVPQGGGVRLMKTGDIRQVAPWDIEYRYEIEPKGQSLQVKGYQTSYGENPTETLIFTCDIKDLAETAATAEAA